MVIAGARQRVPALDRSVVPGGGGSGIRGVGVLSAEALKEIADLVLVDGRIGGHADGALVLAIGIDEADAEQVGAGAADGLVARGAAGDVDETGDGDQTLLTDDELGLGIEEVDEVGDALAVLGLGDPADDLIDGEVEGVAEAGERADGAVDEMVEEVGGGRR
jgi:hypothetical protein